VRRLQSPQIQVQILILPFEFRDLKSEGLQAIVKFSMHSTLIIISPIMFCHIDFFIPAKSAR
jgi:hypothetical protein